MNLKSYQKVVVGVKEKDVWGAISFVNHCGALQFHTASKEKVNTLDVTMKAVGSSGQKISTNGYQNLKLKLETSGMTNSWGKVFSLDTSEVNVADGYPVGSDTRDFVSVKDVPENHWTKATLSKIIVVGGTGLANGVVADSLSLGLSPVVDLVDVSGYKGHFSAWIPQQIASTIAGVTHSTGNTLVKVGAFGIEMFDSLRVTDNKTVTTFQFTQDAAQSAAKPNSEFDWKIHMFEGANEYFANSQNKTVLDVRALHVHGLEDLSMLQSGDDAVLRGKEGQNFKIVLVGMSLDDLSAENFIFAA